MQNKRFLLTTLLTLILLFAFANMSPAFGQADSIIVGDVQVDPEATPVVFSVPVNIHNTITVNAASLGLYYDSGDITIDSIKLGPSIDLINNSFVDADSMLAAIGLIWFPGFTQLAPGDYLLANLWFTLDANAPDQIITIDSGFFPPAGNFILTDATGNSVTPAYVAGTITVGNPTQASLGVDPTELTFNATAGGSNPASQSFDLTNTASADPLTWTASEDAGWFDLSVYSGTTPQTVGVNVSIAGLTAGTYQDTVTIDAPDADNTPQEVVVILNLAEPPPEIGLSQTVFDFEAVEGAKVLLYDTLTISNLGGGTLNWGAANIEAWLVIDPTSGTAPSDMELEVNTNGLAAGVYQDSIEITSATATNSPQKVYVNLTISEPAPEIGLSQVTFNFNAIEGGSNPANQLLTISNIGGGTLNWSSANASGWLTHDPNSGAIDGGNDQVTSLIVDISGLTDGVYTDTVTITDPAATNSPQEVEVILTVAEPAPEIGVSPASFVFDAVVGSNPADQSLDITNLGGGTLDWSASNLTAWLSLDPASGTAPSTVTLSVNTGGLTPGVYEDTITVTGVGATNSPVEIPVTLNVLELTPVLVLSQSQFNFALVEGTGTDTQQLDITNGGGGTLTWSAGNLTAWLTVSPDNGTAPSTVDLTVDASGLAPGTYFDTVTVTAPGANDSPQEVEVVFVIQEQAEFNITQDGEPVTQLIFSGETAKSLDPQVINLATSGAELGFTIDWMSEWLNADPAAGTTPQDVTVSVDISGLGAGTYYDTLTISQAAKDAQPVEIEVVLDLVEPAGEFVVSPTEIIFNTEEGVNPSAQNLTIESDAAEIVWEAAFNTAWLNLSEFSGTTPSMIEVGADVTGLSAGTYYDTITIAEVPLKAAPVEVPVTLNISEVAQPILAVDSSTLGFEALVDGPNPPAKPVEISNAGTGILNWTASFDAPWITVSDLSGTAPSVVNIGVDITGLVPDTYVDTVTIESAGADNSPQHIEVTLVVMPNDPQGGDTVWVATEGALVGQKVAVEINFTNDNTISGIQIPLHFDNSLITCDSVSFAGSRVEYVDMLLAPIDNGAGTINIGVIPTNVDAVPVGSGLLATLYFEALNPGFADIDTGFIAPAGEYVFVDEFVQPFYPVFSSGGVNVEIPSEPCIELSQMDFMFEATEGDADPVDQMLTVSNCGTGSLSWMAENYSGWLSLAPTSGTDGDMITLSVSIAGLTAGVYNDSIMVSDPAASNSPQWAMVELTVNEPGPPTDTVRVTTVEVTTGPAPVIFNVPITLYSTDTISAGSLGFYYDSDDVTIDSVTLDGGAAEGTVDNSFVDPANKLGVIGFIWFPGFQYVLPGDSLLGNLWFTLDANAPEQVINIDSGFFPPGGNFVLTSKVGNTINPAFVPGVINVVAEFEPPVLNVDPLALMFETTIGDDIDYTSYVHVTNTGGGDLDWMASFDASWLVVAPTSGTAPDSFGVTADITGLPTGTYVDTIEVSADGADNSPQYVEVTLLINPEPGLSGTVVDGDTQEPIEGATVEVYEDLMMAPIETTLTDAAGMFEFPELGGAMYYLRAYKVGYYPGVIEVDMSNKIDVMIELIETPMPTPTYEWVNFYCDDNTLNGYPIKVGDVVEAFDPDGVKCGQYYVVEEGSYGLMPVYRDDEYTDQIDEGCEPGDNVSFQINGFPAIATGSTIWTENGDNFQVCLDANEVTEKCIVLNQGWNLISWNVVTETTDLETLISDVMDNVDVILGFEAGAMTYDPDLPAFNTLDMLDHYHGYWFRMLAEDTLCLDGAPADPTTPIALETGWNLASYLPNQQLEVEVALASILQNVLVVLGYENGGLSWDPDLVGFSTLEFMKPMFGYWIKVNADVMLTYPGMGATGMLAKLIPDAFSTSRVPYGVTATNYWNDLYGMGVTVDGELLARGTLIEAIDDAGKVIGTATVTEAGRFGFMPVYGAENGQGNGLTEGESYSLRVNGQATVEEFTMGASGERTFVGTLTLKGGGSGAVPTQYALDQNYPNPFNPETTISFEIPVEAHVRLEVFNILGEKVTTLVDENRSAGSYSVKWNGRTDDGTPVSSGIYFYRLDAGEYVKSMKMTLMK